MKGLHIFAGPSLPGEARPFIPGAIWHGPAAAGDLFRLRDVKPRTICLIDGLFDERPAPWHKELLALMADGCALIGAASIGALRATELDRLGMIGVGTIYRAYRDGRLTGDDEVALAHAPERLGWAALTVPMVEVRATLLACARDRILDHDSARRARSAAHDVHFEDRDWPLLVSTWVGEGIMTDTSAAIVAGRHVRLKQQDALASLQVAARPDIATVRPPYIAETWFFRRFVEEIELNPPG